MNSNELTLASWQSLALPIISKDVVFQFTLKASQTHEYNFFLIFFPELRENREGKEDKGDSV